MFIALIVIKSCYSIINLYDNKDNMMHLKYAGPKPMISEHGISFKDGKEDKYVYLVIAIQILTALDHQDHTGESFFYAKQTRRVNENELMDVILHYHPNIEKTMIREINDYLVHLDNEIEEVKKHPRLSEIEIETYVGNLKVMKEYRVQRAKNKIFYMHIIDTIVEVIKAKKIKKIQTPFYERFWHTLQTIQGHLSSTKSSISAELNVFNDENGMEAVLKINNNQ